MAAPQWRQHLQLRSLPAAPIQLRELHTQRQYAFYARALLAGRLCGGGRVASASEIRAPPGVRRKNSLSPGSLPRASYRIARRSAGSSGHDYSFGVRNGTHARYDLCPQGKAARRRVKTLEERLDVPCEIGRMAGPW